MSVESVPVVPGIDLLLHHWADEAVSCVGVKVHEGESVRE